MINIDDVIHEEKGYFIDSFEFKLKQMNREEALNFSINS